MATRSPFLAVAAASLLAAACQGKPAAGPSSPAAEAAKPAAASAAGSTHKVSFVIEGSGSVGSVGFDVAWTTGGGFQGDTDNVACEAKEESLGAFNNVAAEKTLRVALAKLQGLPTGRPVAECTFAGEAKAADFKVTVKEAADGEANDLDAMPSVKVVVD